MMLMMTLLSCTIMPPSGMALNLQVISHLGPAQASRIRQLQKDARAAATRAATAAALQSSSTSAAATSAADDASAAAALVQSELDDAVASECPLCGEAMIDSVGVPLLDDGDEATTSEWDI